MATQLTVPVETNAALAAARTSRWLVQQYAGTLAYAVSMILIYSALSPLFAYLGYNYYPYELAGLAVLVACTCIPSVMLPQRVATLSDVALYVIYYIVILPCSIIPYLQGRLENAEMAGISAALLLISFAVLTLVLRRPVQPFKAAFDTRQFFGFAIVAGQLSLIGYFFVRFGANINIADLDTMYEQRFAFADALGGGINGYLLAMLSTVFNPLVLAYGLYRRNLIMIGSGMFGCIFAFATLAQRGEIITLLAVPLFYAMMLWGKGMAFRWMPFILAGLSFAGYVGFGLYLAGIPIVQELYAFIFLRTLLVSGTAYGVYAEFFSVYPVTYFSASWPGRLFLDYPYAPFSVGQVIGQFLAGTNNAVEQWNFNANFVATDGIASLGLPGVPIAMALAALLLTIIRKFVDGKDRAFVVAAYVPFLMSITNTSFLTSMISGGGAILAVAIWLSPDWSRGTRQ